jgi:hypothetical protein
VIKNGKVIYKAPSLDRVRAFTRSNLSRFPRELKDVSKKYKYPVIVSSKLKSLRNILAHQLGARQ